MPSIPIYTIEATCYFQRTNQSIRYAMRTLLCLLSDNEAPLER